MKKLLIAALASAAIVSVAHAQESPSVPVAACSDRFTHHWIDWIDEGKPGPHPFPYIPCTMTLTTGTYYCDRDGCGRIDETPPAPSYNNEPPPAQLHSAFYGQWLENDGKNELTHTAPDGLIIDTNGTVSFIDGLAPGEISETCPITAVNHTRGTDNWIVHWGCEAGPGGLSTFGQEGRDGVALAYYAFDGHIPLMIVENRDGTKHIFERKFGTGIQ